MSQELTVKQKLFAREYVRNGGNATRAAQIAGYSGSYETLQTVGSENLRKPLIKAAITKKLSKILDENEVLGELSVVARNRKAKISGGDKMKALELIGKHLNLFSDKLEVTHKSPDHSALQSEIAQSFGLNPDRAVLIVAAVFGAPNGSEADPGANEGQIIDVELEQNLQIP